jgi:hypothetical protein
MELLARRPDLQAARWKLEASLSKIDAAKAAFYPDVNLTGSIGLNSVKAEDLLQLASRTLYIGPSVSLPLFDSKRLDAQLDGARTNRNERIAEYNQTIVDAVREVAQGAQLQGIEQQIVQQSAATGWRAPNWHRRKPAWSTAGQQQQRAECAPVAAQAARCRPVSATSTTAGRSRADQRAGRRLSRRSAAGDRHQIRITS